MNKEPLVSVIILNYNAGELLLDCVESVKKSAYANLEILVVDNISSDESQLKCKERFPDIKLIQNDKNFGYCEGNNIGIRNAKGEFIVILNPDTIVDTCWLNELFSAYKKYGEGLYQPKHLSMKEKSVFMSAGNMFHVFGFGYAREKGNEDKKQFEKVEEIGYASGTCLFTSAKIFEKVGLLDPFIFLYHDDLDFGWRAGHLGIKSYYIPSSVIYHAESYSLKWSPEKFFWLERNRKYCLLTHYSKETYSKLRPTLFLVDLIVWCFYISKGLFWSKIRAEISIIQNRKKIKTRYDELESKKIIPDNELIKTLPDSIFLPASVSNQNNIMNSLITKLSKRVKNE